MINLEGLPKYVCLGASKFSQSHQTRQSVLPIKSKRVCNVSTNMKVHFGGPGKSKNEDRPISCYYEVQAAVIEF